MSEILGTNISAGIVPNNSQDLYATHYATYGDFDKFVVDLAERDAMPIYPDTLNPDGKGSGQRSIGMTVLVGNDDPTLWARYQLQIPIFFKMTDEEKLVALADNSNWLLVQSDAIYRIDGCGGSDLDFHITEQNPRL